MLKNLSLATTAFSVALSSVALASTSALALTLTPTTDVLGWESLGWEVEGRAGAKDPGGQPRDYEFAIGPDGAQANLTGSIYRDWTNGEEVAWTLDWDATTSKASFTIGDQTIVYNQNKLSSNIFNGLSLLTRARSDQGFVEPGTSMFLAVNQVITGQGETVDIDPVISSLSIAPNYGEPQALEGLFFASDESLLSLSGIARLSWDTLNPNAADARSRVTFKLEGFDTNPTNVPEPTSAVAFGLVGLGLLLKRKTTVG